MKTTCDYLFHGLKLTLEGDAALQDSLRPRLGHFQVAPPGQPPDIHFTFHAVPDSARHVARRPPGQARPILGPEMGEVLYFDDSQLLYVNLSDRGRALCDTRTRRVSVSYLGSDPRAPWLVSHPLFTIPLAELLKRQGLYMVHAAGVAAGGKGILLAGASGSGKTTLALALVRGGFHFLGDDTVFLAAPGTAGGDLHVLAFPDEADITDQTVAFFPELSALARSPGAGGRPKQAFSATSLYGLAPCWECRPELLVFPSPSGADRSVIAPMPKGEALLQIVCNVLRTEPGSAQAHLDALAALVHRCRCYRLQTGRDFDELPALMRRVLEENPDEAG
jgi:hypothetical protein